jgi:hypothetical protein
MWKAKRWALLVPTPGSFFSSSIKRAIGSAKRDIRNSRIAGFTDCPIELQTQKQKQT